jgi:hypothetical protein
MTTTCRFCRPGDEAGNQFSNTETANVTLYFDSGRAYTFPALAVHYIGDHGWNPGANFVADIMNYRVIPSSSASRGTIPRKIGYFTNSSNMDLGGVPDACVYRFAQIVKEILEKRAEEVA